jgi:FAD-dependent urate hydroxylase
MTDGVGHDRQVLIVGGGVTAAASAGFLRQSGLDPVLAVPESDSGRARSSLVTISQPGLALLERVGLRRPIERIGTRLTGFETVTHDGSVAATSADRPGVVAIRQEALRDLLRRQTFNRIRQAESPVKQVRSAGSSVQASFTSRVNEQFDTVLTSSLSIVEERDSTPSGRSVEVWEFEWPETVPEPAHPTAAWLGDRAAFMIPLAGGTLVQLVEAASSGESAGVQLDDLQTRFAAAFEAVPDPFPALDRYELEYQQPARAAPASLFVDGIMLAGEAARPSIPGDCLGATLGIEDAWVAADALAYGPFDLDEAGRSYEARRRQRKGDLESELAELPSTDRVPTDLSPQLRRLRRSRRHALGHVTDGDVPDVPREIPDRL